jgi:hypothetical protein
MNRWYYLNVFYDALLKFVVRSLFDLFFTFLVLDKLNLANIFEISVELPVFACIDGLAVWPHFNSVRCFQINNKQCLPIYFGPRILI